MKNPKIQNLSIQTSTLENLLYKNYADKEVTLEKTYNFLSESTNLIMEVNRVRIEIINNNKYEEEIKLNYKMYNLSFLDEFTLRIRKFEKDFEDLMLDKQYAHNDEIIENLKKDLDSIVLRNNHLSYYSLWANIGIQSRDVAEKYMELRHREEVLSNEYNEIADSIDGTAWSYHVDSTLTKDYIDSRVKAAKALHQDCADFVDYIDDLGHDVWDMLESRYYEVDLSFYQKPSLNEYITYLNWKFRYGILNEISVLAIGAGTTSELYKGIIEWMNKSTNPQENTSMARLYS